MFSEAKFRKKIIELMHKDPEMATLMKRGKDSLDQIIDDSAKWASDLSHGAREEALSKRWDTLTAVTDSSYVWSAMTDNEKVEAIAWLGVIKAATYYDNPFFAFGEFTDHDILKAISKLEFSDEEGVGCDPVRANVEDGVE